MINFLDKVWHRRPLALASFIFALGIGVGLCCTVDLNAWLFMFSGAIILTSVALIAKWYHASFFLMIVFALGGILSANSLLPKAIYMEQEDVLLKGYVASDPIIKENRLSFDIESVEQDSIKKEGKLRIYMNKWNDQLVIPKFGQAISINGGRLWLPQGARNPQGFDFRKWEYTKGIYGNVNAKADSLVLHHTYKNSIRKFFIDMRNNISLRIDMLFGKQAKVISGMILGDRQGIPEETLEDYYSTGLSHILAISGTHIIYIMYLINLILNTIKVKRKLLRFFVTIICLCGYTLLVGAPASIIRADILIILSLLAPILGRRNDNVTTLSLALMILLLISPANLLDVGFQLTFGAVAGMSFLLPQLEKAIGVAIFKIKYSKHAFVIKVIEGTLKALALGVAVTIFCIPILLYHFSEVPLISIIASVVVMPIIAIAMPLAIITIGISYCLPPIAVYFGLAVEFLYMIFGSFVAWFSNFTLKLSIAPLPAFLVFIYYLLIYASSEYININKRLKLIAFYSLPLLIVIGSAIHLWSLPKGMTYTQLDAGQADAAVIQYGNKAWLMDCGNKSTPSDDYILKNGLILEDIFISHAHDDHVGGLQEILKKTIPKHIYLPYGWQQEDIDTQSQIAILEAQKRGSLLIELKAGDELTLPFGAVIRTFNPYENFSSMGISANNSSLLLRLVFADRSLLLTGDIEAGAEPDFIPQSDVLKVAHHGSPDASSKHLLDLVNPSVALISSGYNSYGHPSKAVLNRLDDVDADVFRTDEHGAISINISEMGELTVSTYLAGAEDK